MAADEQQAAKKGTRYVLLSLDAEKEGRWIQRGGVDASSAEAAIRTVADKAGEGTYVAIPARSFKAVTVTVETKRAVKLS